MENIYKHIIRNMAGGVVFALLAGIYICVILRKERKAFINFLPFLYCVTNAVGKCLIAFSYSQMLFVDNALTVLKNIENYSSIVHFVEDGIVVVMVVWALIKVKNRTLLDE